MDSGVSAKRGISANAPWLSFYGTAQQMGDLAIAKYCHQWAANALAHHFKEKIASQNLIPLIFSVMN